MTTHKLRAILLYISGTLFAAHLVGEIGIYAFDADKNWLLPFNMDREFNIPTLFSSTIMLACAYILNEIKKVSEKRSFKDWGLLSKIFIFLAIDEFFQIHEIFIIPELRPCALCASPSGKNRPGENVAQRRARICSCCTVYSTMLHLHHE